MIHLLILLAGLALLLAGAEAGIRGASSLGLRAGLSQIAVGLTIVAIGTSLPEFVVSTAATLDGRDGIALANVVGSNIANVLLILGVSALIRPMTVDPSILRSGAPIMLVVSLGVGGLVLTGSIGRLAGLVLVAGLAVYIGWTLRTSRSEAGASEATSEAGRELGTSLGRDLGLGAAGLAMLVAGGSLFVKGAAEGAIALGVPPSVAGLTVVAVGTSLPELATSALAARRGQSDLAIGNIVGSNIFNLSGVLGAAALVDPIAQDGVLASDLALMCISAVALYGFLYTGRRLGRVEGAALLAAYAGYLFTLTMR